MSEFLSEKEREIDLKYSAIITEVLGSEALEADEIAPVAGETVTYVHDPSDYGFVDTTVTRAPIDASLVLEAVRRSYEAIPLDPSE